MSGRCRGDACMHRPCESLERNEIEQGAKSKAQSAWRTEHSVKSQKLIADFVPLSRGIQGVYESETLNVKCETKTASRIEHREFLVPKLRFGNVIV